MVWKVGVGVEVGWLDWICLTTTHVLKDILAVCGRWVLMWCGRCITTTVL